MARTKKSISNSKKKRSVAATSQLLQASAQESSQLFQKLPLEIRYLIYSHHFHATRLSHGFRMVGGWGSLFHMEFIKPTPNALSLLRVCRRAKEEIGDSWLKQVLFNFEDLETMLNKLTPLPTTTLSQIRHLRVTEYSIVLGYPNNAEASYQLAAALKLLPGLQLDTLTVLRGNDLADYSYDLLSSLIAESDGWKELHFLSYNSTLLGYGEPFMYRNLAELPRYTRHPQPDTWRSVIERRDGPSSKPSVTIYRSTQPNQTGSVMKENTRVLFKQKPIEATNDPAEPEFGVNEDLSLTGKGERRKELLIFVRRGGRVDYQEKENSHFISEDIRRDHPGMSWCELRNGYTSDDSWDVGIRRKREAPLPDSYDDANDFVWYHH